MITGNEPINAITPYREYVDDIKRGYPFGLTIRQYFSAMAMQGMLFRKDDLHPVDMVAQKSVAMADALIAELNKTNTI